MNSLKIFFPLILIMSAFISNSKPACKEIQSDFAQLQKKLKQKSSNVVVGNLDKFDELIEGEKLYVTPHVFFDDQAFESFLNFVTKHTEIKQLIILPVFPMYGCEDDWYPHFNMGGVLCTWDLPKSFEEDWKICLAGGWLDKFSRLCKQISQKTEINIALFILKKNAEAYIKKIQPAFSGKNVTSQVSDFSSLHMVKNIDGNPVYIHEIPSLYQDNNWECGYRAIFHAFTLHNLLRQFKGKFIQSLYRLDLQRQAEFEKFYQKIGEEYPKIASKREQQKRLHFHNGIELLDIVFKNKIETIPYVVLIVQTQGSRVSVLADNNRFGMAKKNLSLEQPQIVIYKSFSHWNCFVFTKKAIFVVDSSSAHIYVNPEIVINFFQYFITQSKHVFETEKAADGVANALVFCDVRNVKIKKDE